MFEIKQDLNLSVLKIITGINELKTLTKRISCECKCKLNGRNVIQVGGGITMNVDVSVKDVLYVKKIML